MEDLAVEFLGEDDAYYKAFIYDIHDDGITLTLDKDMQQMKRVNFSQVRLSRQAPDQTDSVSNFAEFERVEVWCQASESEPGCWAPATIKLTKGDFVVLVYSATSNQDIVPIDRVRRVAMPTGQPMVDRNTFTKYVIEVPADLHEIASDVNEHKEFKKACGASLVRFVPEDNLLIVIAQYERVIKKARMLAEMHLRNLRQKMVIRQHTDEVVSKLASTKIKGYLEEFNVDVNLMGLAIGGQGSNICKARDVPGVNNIEIEESTEGCSTFRIFGDTQEAVTEARSILEFVDDVIKVPKIFVAKIIGKNGRNIHDIVDKSGIARVKFQGENETPENDNDEGLMSFIVVGTKESVNNAKILMEYNVTHLKEVEVLRLEKEGADQRLKELTGMQTGHFLPYRERRGSSDFESRGGYGYRSRGRGFRRRGNDRYSNFGDSWNESADEERGAGYYTDSNVPNGRSRGYYRRGRGRRGFYPHRDNIPPSRNGSDSDRIARPNQSMNTDSLPRRRMPNQDEQLQDFNQDQDSYRSRPRRNGRRREVATDTEVALPMRGGRGRSRTPDFIPDEKASTPQDSWASMTDTVSNAEASEPSSPVEKTPQRRPARSTNRGRKSKHNNHNNQQSQQAAAAMVNGGDVAR